MSVNLLEAIDRRSIAITNHPLDFDRYVNLFGYPGTGLMRERSASSSVPPFLGTLIEQVREEVNRQFKQIQAPILGGSNYLPTVWQEEAKRILGQEYPTELLAKYAVRYTAGIAEAKTGENTGDPHCYGGFVLLTELLAEAPPDPFDRLRHYLLKRHHNYPSIQQLKEIRDFVDNHFVDPKNIARARLEAQRFNIKY